MRAGRTLSVLAFGGFALLIAGAFFWPREAAAGWLTGFVYWASFPLGSLAWMMIHALTGGRWGQDIRPVLNAGGRAIPLLWLGIVPVFIALPILFIWYGGHGLPPDVHRHYLNPPFYLVRNVLILGGFTALAFAMLRKSGAFLAAVGLIFYAVAITIVSVDWILALEPGTLYTAFGAATAMEQLGAVLALAAVTCPDLSERAKQDLGGLLIATVLGALYLNYMDFTIAWYGDVPSKIAWFLHRSAMPWKILFVIGLLLGGVGPLLALLFGRTRFSGDHLRAIAISILIGYAAYAMWQILPGFGLIAAGFAVLAMIAMGAALFLFADNHSPTEKGRAHG